MNDIISAIELHKKHMDEQKAASAQHAQKSSDSARQTAEALKKAYAPEPEPAEAISPYPQGWNQFGDAREHQPTVEEASDPATTKRP